MDTLANGSVVVRNPAVGGWKSGEGWRVEEILRLGDPGHGSPAVEFGEIRSVTVDRFGRPWVLDVANHVVMVFDLDGKLVRTIGRSGGGPGEFVNPIGMTWDRAGHLWIADPANHRYTVLDTTGALLAVYPRNIDGWRLPWLGRFGSDGVLRDVSYSGNPVTGRSGALLHRMVGPALQPVDSFTLPGFESNIFRIRFAVGGTTIPVPFSAQLSWSLDNEGDIWWGTGERYQLMRLSPTGDTLIRVEVDRKPMAVSDSERQAAIKDLRELDEPMRSQIDVERLPRLKPSYAWFIVDDQDHLWIRPTAAATDSVPSFEIISPEGRLLGTVPVRVGAWPRPVVIGGYLIGVVPNADGVPQVVLFRVTRAGSPASSR